MSDTPAPSTNMIATRLSSRWRPIAMSHRYRAGRASIVGATGSSATGRLARGGDRDVRLVGGEVAGRREHHALLGRLGRGRSRR